jgi:hypothetical protein
LTTPILMAKTKMKEMKESCEIECDKENVRIVWCIWIIIKQIMNLSIWIVNFRNQKMKWLFKLFIQKWWDYSIKSPKISIA